MAGRGPSGRMAAMSTLADDAPTAHTRTAPIPTVQVSLNQTGPHPILPGVGGRADRRQRAAARL